MSGKFSLTQRDLDRLEKFSPPNELIIWHVLQAHFANRLDAAFQLTIPLSADNAVAARYASSGTRGYAVFPDYRQEEVAAAWCYLPSFGWGLVTKQDTSEAFALLRFQQLLIAGLVCGTVLLVVVVALFVARSISMPIQRAISMSRKVAAGDLRGDVSVLSRDETAILLESLQTMTTDLRFLIGRVQNSSDTLTNTSSKLQATGTDQQHVIQRLGDSTTQTVAAVEEISVTGKELTQTMVAVNEMAGKTGAMAIEGVKIFRAWMLRCENLPIALDHSVLALL